SSVETVQTPRTPTGSPSSAQATVVAGSVLPTLPLVRRGGYDKDAVDAHLRAAASATQSLEHRVTSAESRVQELENELARTKEALAEAEKPTYAGLGGRATSMLRLAEDEAADVRAAATREAA